MDKFVKNDGTLVYVIDDDYKLVYFNDVLKKCFPSLKVGDYCYEKLVNNKNVCYNCPFKKNEKDRKVFYNSFKKKWLSIDTADVNLNNLPGHLILANYLDGSENDLIANIVSKDNFDIVFEIDITANEYFVLSAFDKYTLDKNGKITDLTYEINNLLIDKNEFEHFKNFVDLNNLRDCLLNKSNIKDEFRLKNRIESFEWVQIEVIPFDFNDRLKAFCFIKLINTTIDNKNIDQLKKDELTNLYKGSDFLLKTKEFINKNPNDKYYLIAIDIEHFKIYNDWYGIDKGDEFLKDISSALSEFDAKYNTFSGYFGDDDFCIIMRKDRTLIDSLDEELRECVKKHSNETGFLPLFGIVQYNTSLSLSQLYDRACIAVSRTKGKYSQRICFYDDSMLSEMKKEHVILNDVVNGLKNNEFMFYLQPQCNMITGNVFAAEALVRWKHENRIISPAYFIPILEKTGRIVDLDKYLWEEVIKYQKGLIDRGLKPIPISLNVSRIDLLYLDVANFFIELIETYEISPSIIEIEITESAYVEGIDNINTIVEKLKNYGFKVLMDDFGSGYSSLNMLKNISIDILKMDMKFLDLNEEKNDKGINILESVVNMIKTLNLPIIIEGVENNNQVETLKDMGCQYAQGYYYYRPMPINEFEKIVYDNNKVTYDNIISKKVEQVRIRDLLNENLYSDTLVNNILGAVAFFAVNEDSIELIKVNELYNRLFGEACYLDASYRENIINYFYKEDIPLFRELFVNASNNLLHGANQDLRYVKNNKIIWLHARAYYLNEAKGQRIYYCSFEDITDSKEKDLEVKILNKKLQSTLNLEEIDCWEYDVKSKELVLFSSNTDILPSNLKDGLTLSNFPYCLLKNRVITSTEYLIIQKYISRAVEGYYKDKYVCELPFNINNKSIWLRITGKAIYDNNEVVALIGSYKDITENMILLQNTNTTINMLNDKSSFSLFLNVSQNIIYNTKAIGYYKIFDAIDEKDYDIYITYLSNNSIYPDDKNRFIAEIQRSNLIEKYKAGQSFISIEYRILLNDVIYWRKLFIYLFEQNDDLYAHMYIMDIDNLKNQQNQMNINENIDKSNCGVIRTNKETKEVVEVNDAAVEIFEYASKEELVKHFYDGVCDRVYDSDRDYLLGNQKNLKKLGDSHNLEYRIILDNGEFRYLYATEILIENENHELIIQRTVLDNTDNKKLELELIKENSHKILSEMRFSNENKAILIGLNKLFVASYFCNIAENTYYSMKHTDAVNDLVIKSSSYDDFLINYLDKFVYEEDKAKFYEVASRSNIKKKITPENDYYSFAYRRITNDGYKWFKMDIIASNFDFNFNVETIILGISDISKEIIEKQFYINQIDYYKDLLFNACKDTYLDVVQINLEDLQTSRIYFENGNIKEEILHDKWPKIRKKLLNVIDIDFKDEINSCLDESNLRDLPLEYSKGYRYKIYVGNNMNDYCWILTTIRITEHNNTKFANLFSINVTKDVIELESAKERSIVDGLTGLFNRRMLEIWCNEEAKNYDSYAILFLDINGLKNINDTMGHNVGDYVIKTCAKAIKSITNNDVKGYRFGGDEFLITIVNKSKEEVDSIIVEFNNHLKKLCIEKKVICKVSIGVSYSDDNKNPSDIILKADQDMYKNKQLFKSNNTVEINDNTLISSLISFLDTEFISIYEIDLDNDTYEVIQNNQGTSVNITKKGCYSKMNEAMIKATTKPEYLEERLMISSINYLKNNLPSKNHIEYEYETSVIKDATAIVIYHGSQYDGGIPKKVIMANKIGRKI
ncbi:MAG: EAL domain-containing protein [Anaeroplasma sp.]